MSIASHPAISATIMLTDTTPTEMTFTNDGLTVIKTVPFQANIPSSFPEAAFRAQYPSYALNIGTAAPGVFRIGRYDAAFVGQDGGMIFDVQHDRAPADALTAGNQFEYIQYVTTTYPADGQTGTYIDGNPFYPHINVRNSQTIGMTDTPTRPILRNNATIFVQWRAQTYLVERNLASNALTIRDGIQWGWSMDSATKGSSTGLFKNPSPSCPPATCTGINSSFFTWGEPLNSTDISSSLDFAGTSFDPQKLGSTFIVGQLSYTNGTIKEGTQVDSVDLDIELTFDNINRIVPLFTSLQLINTMNESDDPSANADIVQFVAGGFTNRFHVMEGGTASTTLIARLVNTGLAIPSSTNALLQKSQDQALPWSLEVVGFGEVSGDGFVTTRPVVNILNFMPAIIQKQGKNQVLDNFDNQ